MQKKSKGRKNYVFEAEEVAAFTGTSISMVEKVRISKKNGLTIKGRKSLKIVAIDDLAEDCKTTLIKEIEKIVKL